MTQLAPDMAAPWMCRLEPRTTPTQRSSAAPETLARAVSDLGPGAVAWAVEAAGHLHSATQDSAREFGGGASSPQGLETGLLLLLMHLKEGREPSPADVPRIALEDARTLARQGAPSSVLTEGMWRLHLCVQDALMSSMLSSSDTGASHDDRLRSDLARLTRFSGVATSALVEAYEEESSGWRDGQATRRREIVERLVAGEPLTRQDADRLAIRQCSSHVIAVVTDGDEPVALDDPRLVEISTAVSAQIPRCSLVSTALGTDTLLWWSRPRPIAAVELQRVRQIAVPSGLTITFSDPHASADAVALGYVEAKRAATVARAAGEQRPYVHRDVLLASALLADPAATGDLVSRELAGVLGQDRRSVELRRTLLAFLRSGGSRQAVAERMNVATTTVAYRLDQFERLRGRRLQDSRLETWVALDIVDLVPSVLDGLEEHAAASAS